MATSLTKKTKAILCAIIALFALAGTFIYLYHRNSVKSQEIAQYKQNWKAANDSVEYYKLKNGQLMAEKTQFILSEKDMLAQLNMTKDELKDLKKKLGKKPTTITKIETEIRVDSIYIESKPLYVSRDSLVIPISFSDKWFAMNGLVEYKDSLARTNMYNISMNASLTVGSTENNKFFVTSPNPYLHITDITSVVSEKTKPKRKHWGFGINIGPSVGYDFHHKDIYYGIGGSIGLQYNF